MKGKILCKSDGSFIPMVKKNWYSGWKYLGCNENCWILHNSFELYWKDPNIDLIEEVKQAEELLNRYLKLYE